jgi:hypothetical protein
LDDDTAEMEDNNEIYAWMMIQLSWKIMMRFRMRMRIGRISAVCLVIRTSTALDAHLYYDTITIIYLSLSSSSSNM